MKIREILKDAISELNNNNIEDSSLIAKELLCVILQVDKTYLVINSELEVDNGIYIQYMKNIDRVTKGVPMQYITNRQNFMNISLFVDENVLIPQPDTEILVEEVIKLCKNRNENIQILDLCTGSGAIAISLDKATEIKNKKVLASDISDKALQIAIKNNTKNDTKVKFIKSDIFSNIHEKDFDIIVSNPPYIETSVIERLDNQVKAEPYIALDGGVDGLDFYKIIIKQAHRYLKQGGYLCIEIGYNQKDKVFDLIYKENKYLDIKCIKDLSENDRCVIARKI